MIKPKKISWIIASIATSLGLGFYLLGNPKTVVTQVIDGDTIRVQNLESRIKNLASKNKKEEVQSIRLIGVDAPELAKGKQENECFAVEAKKILEDLVLGQKVKLEFDENQMDRFGRLLAYVYAKNGLMVNQYLLENGAAEFQLDTVNLKYQKELVAAANQAHQKQTGLWQVCDLEKNGCNIKGNLDKNDKRWYHLPSFRHYNQATIRPELGERWFCTEKQAIEAGFAKARE